MANTEPTELAYEVDAARDKAERAHALRILGASWNQIAKACGYFDKSTAYRAVKTILDEVPAYERDQHRQLWGERVEWLWREAAKAVTEGRPGSVTAAVRTVERAAKLHGLDAPTEVTVSSPSDAYLREWVAAVIAKTDGELPREADVIEGEITGE